MSKSNRPKPPTHQDQSALEVARRYARNFGLDGFQTKPRADIDPLDEVAEALAATLGKTGADPRLAQVAGLVEPWARLALADALAAKRLTLHQIKSFVITGKLPRRTA